MKKLYILSAFILCTAFVDYAFAGSSGPAPTVFIPHEMGSRDADGWGYTTHLGFWESCGTYCSVYRNLEYIPAANVTGVSATIKSINGGEQSWWVGQYTSNDGDTWQSTLQFPPWYINGYYYYKWQKTGINDNYIAHELYGRTLYRINGDATLRQYRFWDC